MLKAAVILLLALAALVTIGNEAVAQRSGACRFTGTVRLDGAEVPDGTVVQAIVGGDVFTTATPTGYAPSTYSIEVVPPEGKSYDDGTEVRFRVNGCTADQVGYYGDGENIRWDLTASCPSRPLTPTSGTSPGASLVALIAVVFVAQLSAFGGVAYIAVTDWAT